MISRRQLMTPNRTLEELKPHIALFRTTDNIAPNRTLEELKRVL